MAVFPPCMGSRNGQWDDEPVFFDHQVSWRIHLCRILTNLRLYICSGPSASRHYRQVGDVLEDCFGVARANLLLQRCLAAFRDSHLLLFFSHLLGCWHAQRSAILSLHIICDLFFCRIAVPTSQRPRTFLQFCQLSCS